MSNDSIIIHGHLLKEAREDLNLSLEDVARQLTLTLNTSPRWKKIRKMGLYLPQSN